MPQVRALTVDAAMRAKELYAELDHRGRRVYSIQKIAKILGVGESTIGRVVNGYGGYGAVPEPLSDPAMQAAAKASEQRLLDLLAQQATEKAAQHPNNLLKELDDDSAGYGD